MIRPTPDDLRVRSADPRSLDSIVDTLAAGFLDGDFADWLIPDAEQRAATYPGYFRILVEHTFAVGGRIDLVGHGDGVAVWHEIPAYPESPTPMADYESRLAGAVGEALPRFQIMDKVMETHHPATTAHHYLTHIAVRPQRRGLGLGSALLRHHHGYLDAHQIPAYLEATGAANQCLYLRHGYERRIPYRISDGPDVLPMWRSPKPAGS